MKKYTTWFDDEFIILLRLWILWYFSNMYLNSSSLISCDIFDLLCFVIKFLFITNIIFKMITISYLSQMFIIPQQGLA